MNRHDQVIHETFKVLNAPENAGLINPDLRLALRKELLKSSSLPGRAYQTTKITRVDKIYDILIHGSHEIDDILVLIARLGTLVRARSYKSHRMPVEFYKYIEKSLSDLHNLMKYANETLSIHLIIDTLKQTINYIDRIWGYSAVKAKVDKWCEEHPVHDRADIWEQDRKYRFGAYYKYRNVFQQMVWQLTALTTEQPQ